MTAIFFYMVCVLDPTGAHWLKCTEIGPYPTFEACELRSVIHASDKRYVPSACYSVKGAK
jgi:hypothetical protein